MNERTEELDVNAAEPVHRETEDALWLPARRPMLVLPAGHAENSFRFFCVPGHGVPSLTLAKRFLPTTVTPPASRPAPGRARLD